MGILKDLQYYEYSESSVIYCADALELPQTIKSIVFFMATRSITVVNHIGEGDRDSFF